MSNQGIVPGIQSLAEPKHCKQSGSPPQERTCRVLHVSYTALHSLILHLLLQLPLSPCHAHALLFSHRLALEHSLQQNLKDRLHYLGSVPDDADSVCDHKETSVYLLTSCRDTWIHPPFGLDASYPQ